MSINASFTDTNQDRRAACTPRPAEVRKPTEAYADAKRGEGKNQSDAGPKSFSVHYVKYFKGVCPRPASSEKKPRTRESDSQRQRSAATRRLPTSASACLRSSSVASSAHFPLPSQSDSTNRERLMQTEYSSKDIDFFPHSASGMFSHSATSKNRVAADGSIPRDADVAVADATEGLVEQKPMTGNPSRSYPSSLRFRPDLDEAEQLRRYQQYVDERRTAALCREAAAWQISLADLRKGFAMLVAEGYEFQKTERYWRALHIRQEELHRNPPGVNLWRKVGMILYPDSVAPLIDALQAMLPAECSSANLRSAHQLLLQLSLWAA